MKGDAHVHRGHRIHRNVLYVLIIVLLGLQIFYFNLLNVEVTSLRNNLEDMESDFDDRLDLYREELSQITTLLFEQQSDLETEISLIKSSSGDFSGIIERAVEGVVGVGTQRSVGTGFIIDDEGYVVTNYHVIDDGTAVSIITFENDLFDAEVIGFDIVRDVALLKIEPGNYRELPVGDADDVQVGNPVIAIGNPLGLSFSVVEGIVSATDRNGPSGLNEYIQTDLALNPGNSGGPLINKQGEVIGINNFKISGGAEGLGFALESDSFRESVNVIANETII